MVLGAKATRSMPPWCSGIAERPPPELVPTLFARVRPGDGRASGGAMLVRNFLCTTDPNRFFQDARYRNG